MKKIVIITILLLAGAGMVQAYSPQYGITNNMIAYWEMDTRNVVWTSASAGYAIDSTVNGNNGTLTSMTKAASPKYGIIGQGLDFVSSRLSITGNSSNRIIGDLTLSIWGKADSFKAGSFNNTFFSSTGAATELEADNWIYYFSVDDGTHILRSFHESGAGTDNSVVSTAGATSVVVNQWNHYVLVRNTTANTITFYVNGSQIGSAVSYTTDPSGGSNANLQVGQHNITSTNNWDGVLDDARIYNRALSANEVKMLYRLGLMSGKR